VEQVWSRLAGCFGEGLSRKFGDDPPAEWRSVIAELNDYQLAQGMRRLKHSGKPHPPSLPEFVKLCRTVGHADDVSDVRVPTDQQLLPGPSMDRWQLAGNRRLLGHITRRIPKDPRCYHGGEGHAANIHTLVAMKNRWVELMQDAATVDGVPPDEQNQSWRVCMAQAEEIIAAGHAA
jgi:hypothetical protein